MLHQRRGVARGIDTGNARVAGWLNADDLDLHAGQGAAQCATKACREIAALALGRAQKQTSAGQFLAICEYNAFESALVALQPSDPPLV